jgi:succinate dehydrogenase/fumarate reductase-like Fe-S protein
MLVEIIRSGGRETYEVPSADKPVKVMDILDYIYLHLDHTLAYYRHSSCNQGVCGRCAVKLNGKTVLACGAVIEPGTEKITLSPATGNVVRDLVVR